MMTSKANSIRRFPGAPARIALAMVAVVIGIAGCADSSDAPVETHAFHSDLENTVVLAIRRGVSDEELLRQIDRVARRHELDDWKSAEKSFVAIGSGLRQAGAADNVADSVAQLVSGGDPDRRQLVLQAYTE